MVGIKAGRGFKELYTVDQFALCGISPKTRLTFEELLKQSIRISVLLHTDFRKPPGVKLPFSSASANDLKGWLQAQSRSESDKSNAVKVFYKDTTGHKGLTWQPYLKSVDGELLPRTDPRVWQSPKATRTEAPPKAREKRQRPGNKEDENAKPSKKQKSQKTKPSASEESSHFEDTKGPIPERKRSAYAATPGSREEVKRKDRAAAGTPPRSPRPGNERADKPESREEPKRSERAYTPTPPSVPERERRTYSKNPSARARSSWFESANGAVPERKRSTYATTPGYREEPQARERAETPPPSSHASPNHTPPESDEGCQEEPREEPQEESQEEHEEKPEQNRRDSLSPSPEPVPQSPYGTEYSLDDLFALARIAGDPTGLRIAIACLPDQDQCIVTMAFDSKRCLRYRVEEIDIVGRTVSNDYGSAYPTTYKELTTRSHTFLGRFADVSEVELNHFALALGFYEDHSGLPLGDRSPVRDTYE